MFTWYSTVRAVGKTPIRRSDWASNAPNQAQSRGSPQERERLFREAGRKDPLLHTQNHCCTPSPKMQMRHSLLLIWLMLSAPTAALTVHQTKMIGRRTACASLLTTLAAFPTAEPVFAKSQGESPRLRDLQQAADHDREIERIVKSRQFKAGMERRLVQLARSNGPGPSDQLPASGPQLEASKVQVSKPQCTEAVQRSAEAVLNSPNLYFWERAQAECGADYKEFLLNAKLDA